MKSNPDNFSQVYRTEDGSINKDINSYNVVELIHCKRLTGGVAIQLGLGDGFVAEQLASYYDRLIVIEGSEQVIQENFKNDAGYEIIHSYFEEFIPDFKCDVILGNHVLEHVDNPVEVLSNVKNWLKSDGRAIFTVPNASSLHRRIGVEMGMMKVLHEFNNQDIQLGHQRVYYPHQLDEHIRLAGFSIIESGGYMLKLVSNQQMKSWSPELLHAIFRVSLSSPAEICSNISVICKPE